MDIVIWNSGFVCWFSEYVFFSKASLVFGIFKMGLEVDTSVKIFQFFVKRGLLKPVFVSWFSEYVFFSKASLVFGIFKMGLEFDTSVKVFQFFVNRGLLKFGTKFELGQSLSFCITVRKFLL